jgi:hypothetical protein
MRPLFAHLMKETAICSPPWGLSAQKSGIFRRNKRSLRYLLQEQAV